MTGKSTLDRSGNPSWRPRIASIPGTSWLPASGSSHRDRSLAGSDLVIDDDAKTYLHDDLRWIREAMVSKLDGLSEYDIRRPLTYTGTNLLGLIKHLS